MMNNPLRESKGFSLLEMLVYIGLLLVVVTTSITVVLSLRDIVSEQKTNRLLTQNATQIAERMLLEIRQADEIVTAQSVLASNAGVLVLNQDTDTIRLELSGNNFIVTTNGVASTVSDDQVAVSKLRFDEYDSGQGVLVRANFVLDIANSAGTTSEEFYTAAVLRGSYE